MLKKIVFLIVVLLLVGGGFFYYWWQNQADVRELNRGLPEGVRVVKSFFGDEYWVINQIDGYKFRVPKAWQGIVEIEYIPERRENGYIWTNLELEGKEGEGRMVTIGRHKLKDAEENLEEWAKKSFDFFGLVGNFSKDRVGEYEIVKTTEDVHLWGMWVYFFKKNNIIYTITGPSEEFIQEIILNGKW